MFLQLQKTESFYRLSTVFSWIAGSIFLLGFAGWIFNLSSLTEVDSGWSPIKPVCSISGILLVLSNLLIIRRRAQLALNFFLAFIPLLLATISIVENLSNAATAFGDQFVQSHHFSNSMPHPGRISFSSGVLYFITSIGLLFGLKKKSNIRLSQYSSMLVIYLSTFLLVGHLLRSDPMISKEGILHGSIHSLYGLLILNLAILSRTPEYGIIQFYRQNSPAVRAHFWLFLQTAGLLVVIAWLRFKGEEIGLYNATLGLPIIIVLFIGVLLIVISRSAANMVKMERKNLQLVKRLESQKSELEAILSRTNDGVYTLDENLTILSANQKALESVQKTEEQVL
ncbi:MAG TPA: hypothetical protein VLC28_08810, partial [Flavitalea sp.]|nr:hypothetical protein [Flavitalea sp.]